MTVPKPEYSDAAMAYADTKGPRKTSNHRWFDWAEGFDAGAASVTVRAEPITTAAELAEYEATSEAFRDATGQVWRWSGGWWRMTGDSDGFTSRYVTEKHRLPLTLLAPASPPVPEPVLLTADDPRIRDGALASLTTLFSDDGETTTFVRRIGTGYGWDPRDVRRKIERGEPIILLAEAPDPDAETRADLQRHKIDLDVIRALGYDVVRADA